MVSESVSSKAKVSWGPAVLDRLLAILKADLRKTVLMCVLVVVLAGVLIRTAGQPNQAEAMVEELAPPTEVATAIQSVALEPPNPSDSPEPTAIDTPMKMKRPENTLPQRDIFAIDLSYFTKSTTSQAQNDGQANRPTPEQLRLAALRRQIQEFRLQSTMTGPVPAVYIDGTMLGEGDVYQGFKIARINDRQVLLEKDDHVFGLNMAGE